MNSFQQFQNQPNKVKNNTSLQTTLRTTLKKTLRFNSLQTTLQHTTHNQSQNSPVHQNTKSTAPDNKATIKAIVNFHHNFKHNKMTTTPHFHSLQYTIFHQRIYTTLLPLPTTLTKKPQATTASTNRWSTNLNNTSCARPWSTATNEKTTPHEPIHAATQHTNRSRHSYHQHTKSTT